MAKVRKIGFGDLQNIVSNEVDASTAQKMALQNNIIPKLTTTERGDIPSADLYEGLMIYNETTKSLNVYNGTAWIDYAPEA